jgi:hypothetical protein
VIKPVSISRGDPVILFPLLFVLIMSAGKDIIEDVKRHKSDNSENNMKTLVWNNDKQTFLETCWKDVKVG